MKTRLITFGGVLKVIAAVAAIYLLPLNIIAVPGFPATATTWTGSSNSDWNTTGNWTDGIPGQWCQITIPATGNAPVITGSFTLDSESVLTIEPGGALTVTGDFINDGTVLIGSSSSASGSLIIRGTASGPGQVNYLLTLREGTDAGDRHLVAAPVAGHDISGFISDHDAKIDNVRTWDEAGGTWTDLASGVFSAGRGYNLYQSDESDGTFLFTGSLMNSVSVEATSPFGLPYSERGSDPYGSNPEQTYWAPGRGYIDGEWQNWGGGGWNLLGNPFTSSLDAGAFIAENEGDFDPYYEALYVYDGKSGNYRYVASSIPGYEPEFTLGDPFGSRIQAGQGFMVMANNDGAGFDFNSGMQVHDTELPMLKSAPAVAPWPGLKLKVRWGENENLTTVVFNDEMSYGLDPGYDVGLLSTGPGVEIYTTMEADGGSVSLTRQAFPAAGADTIRIPLGVDCYSGATVTFSANAVPLPGGTFWLEDRALGVFTDISENSYVAVLPKNTYGTGRFYLVAVRSTTAGTRYTETENSNLRIWAATEGIIISGEVSQQTRYELYDLGGRRVLEGRLSGGDLNMIHIPGGMQGLFMVRVTDGLAITTRKIALL